MRFLIAAMSLAALLFTGNAAHADRRVAFVVGNAAYKNVPQLPNPAIDARSMARVLRNVGFDVVEGANLSRDAMTTKLLEFGKKSEGADVALFFYAGHGIAVNGTNYLLPVDADLKSEMDVKLGAAINVDLTLEQTMADAKVKLVFLDACRDNPFAAKIRSARATRSVSVASGLAEMKSGEGTLIAFATGPGQTALDGEAGTNSPFTRALIANIAQPGLEIQQAMTKVRAQVNDETNKAQLPWGHTNLKSHRHRFSQPGGSDCAGCRGADLRRPGRRGRARVLALDQGQQQGRGAQRLPHQLSERHLQVAGARPHRRPPGGAVHDDAQSDGRRRSVDLHGRRRPDLRRPDRSGQGPASRCAAAPHRSRFRRQGDRQVRRGDPVGDQALAGRARLSRHRLPQQAPAQGDAVRDRLHPRRLRRFRG